MSVGSDVVNPSGYEVDHEVVANLCPEERHNLASQDADSIDEVASNDGKDR